MAAASSPTLMLHVSVCTYKPKISTQGYVEAEVDSIYRSLPKRTVLQSPDFLY